jgi:hypothetical protein
MRSAAMSIEFFARLVLGQAVVLDVDANGFACRQIVYRVKSERVELAAQGVTQRYPRGERFERHLTRRSRNQKGRFVVRVG